MTSTPVPSYPSRRGFSLVEVAIAVVIVSVVVITTVGLLAPVQQNIENVVSADEVSRLRRAVEIEMNIVRPGEANASGVKYTSGFNKAYDTVQNDSVVYAFFYRAAVPMTLTGGRADPATGAVTGQRLGDNYAQQAAVFIENQLGQAQSEGFIEAAEGRVFIVRFQLLESVMDPDAVASYNAGGAEQFSEAVLPVSAEFYTLDSIDMVANGGASTALDVFVSGIKSGDVRPVFELNMAFNR